MYPIGHGFYSGFQALNAVLENSYKVMNIPWVISDFVQVIFFNVL
jgi:hypothetical protein